jgi:hypothetical protein
MKIYNNLWSVPMSTKHAMTEEKDIVQITVQYGVRMILSSVMVEVTKKVAKKTTFVFQNTTTWIV